MSNKIKRQVLCLLIALLIVPSISGCIKKQEEKKKSVEKLPVKTVRVVKDILKEYLFYVGDIKAKDEAIVYPKVPGKIIEKFFKEGDPVKKADVIAYIDRDEVGFQFEKAPAESPIDGIVGNVYVDVGTSVSPQTPVALVVGIDTVKVKINVVDRDLPRIQVGQATDVELDAYPNEVFKGAVGNVSPVVDLSSRTAPVEITIPNSDYRIKPGMFARVNILIANKEGVLVIPRDAIIKEDSSSYVFIVKDDNKVHRQKIETGLREDNRFEVVTGLSEGECLVTMGNAYLKEGDMVEVVNDFDIKEQKQ